jgi:recombination protein RecA
MRLGDNTVQAVEAVSTGSLTLDIALGIGGLPKGRIVEIYGPESSGKTTMTLQALLNVKKRAVRVPLSMLNMHLIHNMHVNLA